MDIKQHYLPTCLRAESRRDQEEGGELDSHEEVSPEEIKSGEVELDFFCFSCFPTVELRTL